VSWSFTGASAPAMRVQFGVLIGPPNVAGFPKPASSINTSRTFGAPSGASTCPISPQSGWDPPRVLFAVPWKRCWRIGSALRSGEPSATSIAARDRGRILPNG
jgi:hypothetical protein